MQAKKIEYSCLPGTQQISEHEYTLSNASNIQDCGYPWSDASNQHARLCFPFPAQERGLYEMSAPEWFGEKHVIMKNKT